MIVEFYCSTECSSAWVDCSACNGRTAAADAVVIVVLVLSSWGGHRLSSEDRTAAADAVVIVVLVLSSRGDIGLVAIVVLLPLMQQ